MSISLDSAKQLVTEINQKLCSSHQLIDRTTYRAIHPDEYPDYYKRFQNLFIRLLRYDCRRLNLLKTIDSAASADGRLLSNSRLKPLVLNLVLAKFGIGSDGAMAAQGWLQTVRSTHVIFLETTSNPRGISEREDASHSFVLLNIPLKNFRASPGESIEQVLENNQEGILFDPGLGYACSISEFQKSPLPRFIAKWNTHYISDVVIGNLSDKELDILVGKINLVYEGTKRILKIPSLESFGQSGIFLKNKYQKEIGPKAVSSLKILYPDLEWKQKVSGLNFILSTKGEKEPLDSAKEELELYNLNVEIKDKTLRIINPDPVELEKFVFQVNPNCWTRWQCKSHLKAFLRWTLFTTLASCLFAVLMPKKG